MTLKNITLTDYDGENTMEINKGPISLIQLENITLLDAVLTGSVIRAPQKGVIKIKRLTLDQLELKFAGILMTELKLLEINNMTLSNVNQISNGDSSPQLQNHLSFWGQTRCSICLI